MRGPGVQESRSSGVQEFRSSGVQEFRSSGVQELRKAARATKYVFSVKHSAIKAFQEVKPEEHAEGVIGLSPGWSEAEPWVLNLVCDPLYQSGRGARSHRLAAPRGRATFRSSRLPWWFLTSDAVPGSSRSYSVMQISSELPNS